MKSRWPGILNNVYGASCIGKKSFNLTKLSGIYIGSSTILYVCIVFTISILSFFTEGTVDPADIEDLFDQLEDYSDSGPDADTISIGSTPKPSLKPFFCSSRNLLHEARSVVAAAAVAKAQSKYSSHIYLVQKPGFKPG